MKGAIKNLTYKITIRVTRHALIRMADRGKLHLPDDPIPNYAYQRARAVLKRGVLKNGVAQRTPPTAIPPPPCVYLESEGWVAVLLRPRFRSGRHWKCVTCFPIDTQNMEETPTPPYCNDCKKAMRLNVPRLGEAGGYVHEETDSFHCAPITPQQAS